MKKKQPKSKDAAPTSSEGTTRGRGRGGFEGRGRGRGADRGGRGGRGSTRGVSQSNGTKHDKKAADDGWGDPQPSSVEATGGWDSAPTNGDPPTTDWANDAGQDSLTSLKTEEPKPAPAAAPVKKSGGWAGLFAKPDPPKSVPAPAPIAQPEETTPTIVTAPAQEDFGTTQRLHPPPIEPLVVEDGPSELPSAPHSETASQVTPSKDELTEDNLERLPDESHPPASQTQASTVASTVDVRAQHESKPAIRPTSGYAATALKATSGAGRSASFNRKVMEQQEAVVMPGNHAVEKTAVQFGKMGLNGDGDVDVDEDREEPETRTQLPDDSPAAPRASLPPVMQDSQVVAPSMPTEIQPPTEPQAHRQAPGLPAAPQGTSQPSQQALHSSYTDPYRYGPGQKAYDPFGQTPSQTQSRPTTQEPFSSQIPGQTQPGAQQDYAGYYSREQYQNYYGSYGQGQDSQRSGSAFGTSAPDISNQYATARPQQGYGQPEAPNSGNNTPAPNVPTHQAQPSQHLGGQSHAGYPYGYPAAYNQQYPQYGQNYMSQMSHQHRYGANRPMFDDVRRQEEYYGGQYGYGHNQQYGASYKSGMYNQPGQQQYSYEHSSSPANVSGFGGRDAYGRSGSAQPSEGQQSGAGGHTFGGMQDPFGRSSSGFGQSQAMSQQHSSQHGEDVSKPSGPSPSVQAGRPGSTTNSQSQQSGLVPPQSQHSGQQAFGGYPQYGGFGGNFGGQQNAQSTGYGGYGSNAFGSYGGYGGGRGWNH